MSVRIRMPSISFVVARSEPGHVIGCDNRLPWHLRTDLQNFKKITTNHVVVMGRKTFDSIGRPLPNRINVVLSSRPMSDSGSVYFAQNRVSALYLADLLSTLNGYDEIFVIGGGAIYREFPYNKIHLTEVYGDEIAGDTHFNAKFDLRKWELQSKTEYPASSVDEYPFAIKVLKKKDKTTFRSRAWSLARFFTPDLNLEAWEAKQLEKLKLPRLHKKERFLSSIQLEFPNVRKGILLPPPKVISSRRSRRSR